MYVLGGVLFGIFIFLANMLIEKKKACRFPWRNGMDEKFDAFTAICN
jgi:hypothetical protein